MKIKLGGKTIYSRVFPSRSPREEMSTSHDVGISSRFDNGDHLESAFLDLFLSIKL